MSEGVLGVKSSHRDVEGFWREAEEGKGSVKGVEVE